MLQVTDVQDVVAGVAARVGPAVAGLERGSGVVVARDRVLTSAHVLRAEELRIDVGGEARPARVIGVDPELGLAVLAVATQDVEPVEWAAGPTGLGTPVIALADPGGRGLRATLGHVAAAPRPVRGPTGRRVAGALEHTAPVPRGAAGGPLTDVEGRLLGINASRLEGGFILALPADAAMRARVDALCHGATPERPRLGLALARPRNRADGLVVRAVQDASPAAVAGIHRGDLLVAVEGRPVRSVDDVVDAVERAAGAVTLTIVRGRAERDTELRLLQ